MKSCEPTRQRTAIYGGCRRQPAATNQIGFQNQTGLFSFDPSRNTSPEGRRDACETCLEANFWQAGSLVLRQARLPQPHCSHAGAEAGRLHFFRQFKVSLAS